LTCGDVRVDRQHAPSHAIPAGRERWQRYSQQHAVGTVDLRIALVNALADPVENLDCAMQPMRGPLPLLL